MLLRKSKGKCIPGASSSKSRSFPLWGAGNGEGGLGRVEAGTMILTGVSLEAVLEKTA